MSERKYAILSLLALFSLILAACDQRPAALEQLQGLEAGSAAFVCEDAIGCVDIAPGEAIHIAFAMVISGPNASLGIDSRNGIEIAIADVGSEILGHPIKLDGEDSGCSEEGGRAAAIRLAADPTIIAVIGTSCSSEARVGVPLLAEAGFVVVSPSNTAPDLTEPDSQNNYVPAYARTAHNDNLQGRIAAEYAFNELGVTRAATIHDGSLYADQLQQVFAARFKELGGTITSQETVDPNQTDMAPVLATIAGNAPELIYFPIFLPAGGFIIHQAKQTTGLEQVILLGADGLFSPEVIEAAGEDIEGFKVSSPAVAGDTYAAFVEKYKARFGSEPISIFHAHAFDAFMLIKNAIEIVAVQGGDGTLHIGRLALRNAVHNTTNYPGLTGNLTCNLSIEPVKYPGDCAEASIGIYEYHAATYPPGRIWP